MTNKHNNIPHRTKNRMNAYNLPVVHRGLTFDLRVTVQTTRVDVSLIREKQTMEAQDMIPPDRFVEMFSIQLLRWDDKRELHLDHIHARFAEYGNQFRDFWKGFGKKALCITLMFIDTFIYNGRLAEYTISLKAMSSVSRQKETTVLSTMQVLDFFVNDMQMTDNLVLFLLETPTKTAKNKFFKHLPLEYNRELLETMLEDLSNPNVQSSFNIFFDISPKLLVQLREAVAKYISQRSLESYYAKEYGFSVVERNQPPLPKQPFTHMETPFQQVVNHCRV